MKTKLKPLKTNKDQSLSTLQEMVKLKPSLIVQSKTTHILKEQSTLAKLFQRKPTKKSSITEFIKKTC